MLAQASPQNLTPRRREANIHSPKKGGGDEPGFDDLVGRQGTLAAVLPKSAQMNHSSKFWHAVENVCPE